MRTFTVPVLLVGAALIALTGCTADAEAGPPGSLPEVNITELSGLTADLDYERGTYALPTDEYSLNAPGYVMRVLHAIAVKADDCVEAKGFPPVAGNMDWSAYEPEEDRSFGRWSPALASQYGISVAPDAGPPASDLLSRGPKFNNAYNSCSESAKQELLSVLEFSQSPNIVNTIAGEANRLASTSEVGKIALAEWRACAEDAGVVLELNSGQPVQTYIDKGKEAEIAAYVVYAECAKSTGAVQRLADLRVQYETALLRTQEVQIQAFADQVDDAVAELDDVILGG